jgi:peptidoglycan/xylan/chitin deacetylase (PgdA/CDA1 family)
MEYLRDAGYRSITPEQYERWVSGEDVPLPAKPILITFDDGQSSLQLATPVLKQTGFATTVYVVSGRYRFEVRNPDDLTAFKSGLDSSRFSR